MAACHLATELDRQKAGNDWPQLLLMAAIIVIVTVNKNSP
jgi:hypothetical protein